MQANLLPTDVNVSVLLILDGTNRTQLASVCRWSELSGSCFKFWTEFQFMVFIVIPVFEVIRFVDRKWRVLREQRAQ